MTKAQHNIATIIQIAACFAICATCALAMYAISHGVWKYLPIHLALIFIQFCIVGAMIYIKGRIT